MEAVATGAAGTRDGHCSPSYMSAKEDDVFVDAEEEVTPRRSGRKRRSTAGNSTPNLASKKPKQSKMPTERSPGARKGQDTTGNKPGKQAAPPGVQDDQDAFWARMGGLLGEMETRLKRETNDVKDQLGQAIGDLGTRVGRTEKRLDEITDEVHQIIDRRLASSMQILPQGPTPSAVSPSASPPPKTYATAVQSHGLAASKPGRPARSREDEYWRCRKALRLRPIEGSDGAQAVRDFITNHLKQDEDFLDSLGPFDVQRIPSGPAARIRKEAVVFFASVDARDAVKGAAKNLAGKSSDYGVRLELPNHLKSAMQSIQSVSYQIKKKYPESRRNVLFDDGTMDLVLDFSISEGKNWRRLTSSQARERKKKSSVNPGERLNVDAAELDGILESSEGSSEEENNRP